MSAGSEAEWLAMALRSREIGRRVAGLLNELASLAPDAVSAQVYGPGFRICGMGGGFRVESLLSADDERAANQLR